MTGKRETRCFSCKFSPRHEPTFPPHRTPRCVGTLTAPTLPTHTSHTTLYLSREAETHLIELRGAIVSNDLKLGGKDHARPGLYMERARSLSPYRNTRYGRGIVISTSPASIVYRYAIPPSFSCSRCVHSGILHPDIPK